MAKAAPTKAPVKATNPEKDKSAPLDPTAQMASYLKKTEKDHFNLVETVPPLRLSTGSLNLDMEMGGFSEGAHRIMGGPNLGKTPFAINCVDTFLDEVPNSRAVWCKAEGRLSERNMSRSRHRFVFKAEDWVVGTILVFKNNIYEAWIDLMRDLVMNNPTKCRYAFVTDSMNSLILRNDQTKATDEASRVAGAPMLTSQLFQRIGMALNEMGHIAFFLSQVTSEIKLNPYDKTPPRQGSSSGGNSIAHNANESLEFLNWYEGDLILKNPDERLHRTNNPALGHVLKVKLQKSSSEKRFVTVEIPIKYGVTHGSAIWREREIGDQMLAWGLVSKTNPNAEKKEGTTEKKGGSWLYMSPALLGELEAAGITGLPEKVQGLNQLYDLLETRRDVADHLFVTFKKRIGGGAS